MRLLGLAYKQTYLDFVAAVTLHRGEGGAFYHLNVQRDARDDVLRRESRGSAVQTRTRGWCWGPRRSWKKQNK